VSCREVARTLRWVASHAKVERFVDRAVDIGERHLEMMNRGGEGHAVTARSLLGSTKTPQRSGHVGACSSKPSSGPPPKRVDLGAASLPAQDRRRSVFGCIEVPSSTGRL